MHVSGTDNFPIDIAFDQFFYLFSSSPELCLRSEVLYLEVKLITCYFSQVNVQIEVM